MTPAPQLSGPARRAPARAGYTRPEQLAQVPNRDRASRYGADRITALRDAFDERGLAFRNCAGGGFQMARLIYSAIASLDGYVEDVQGKFGWATPDEEVHAFVNDLERPVGTHLYGRRMYETMVYWETGGDQAAVTRDFAEIWRAAEKVVYSRTLHTVSSERTRIEREFDAAAIRRLKARDPISRSAGRSSPARRSPRGWSTSAILASEPGPVGGGKRALPAGVHAELELLEERRFRSGVVYLRYRL